MDKSDIELLNEITDSDKLFSGAYNIRKDCEAIERHTTDNIDIVPKKDVSGIDIIIKDNTKDESLYIPVILTRSGLKDVVYNDFHVGKNANIVIYAGCGIHNPLEKDTEHDGIHRFFLDEGATVKYVENHYGEGSGTGKRVLNPVTEITMKDGAVFEMETTQIKGVDSTVRITKADLDANTNLIVKEKIMTHDEQFASTEFELNLDGENASANLTSRAVAVGNSVQTFVSKVYGNDECFSHVSCDAIIKDNAKVTSIPEITANNVNANLVHEAAIGKIAQDQLIKLMTLGFSEEEAEEEIIKGFLK